MPKKLPVVGPPPATTRPVLPGSVWDESRCEEFELLGRLLNEVTMIARGSNCLERIAKCIEMAEKLSRHDWKDNRQDFYNWLHERVLVDRFGENYRDKREES